MNLIKYWNPKFAIQNIKKSKSILALFLGLFPILNFLILLLMFRDQSSVLQLDSLSLLQFIGMYLIPMIIGISLFSYLFKRKSVDFIGSMPLSRKTIYVTNVITGLGLLAIFVLVNTGILFFASKISGYTLPLAMIGDYFLIWLVTYFFIFAVSMIAISVSGNIMTVIAVSMLLFLLIPFLHDYTKSGWNQTEVFYLECNHQECLPQNYTCNDYATCENKVKENQYQLRAERSSNYVYTMPYELFHYIVYERTDGNLYNQTSFGKMIVLGISSFVISFFLFSKRKLENTETSFKNYWVHSFVKGLTMIPFLVFIYELVDETSVSILVLSVLVCLLIGYFFLYDLITKKGIGHWKDSILSFFLIVSIGGLLIVTLDHLGTTRVFKEKNIDKLVFDIYPHGENSDGNRGVNELEIHDQKLISKILSVSLDQEKTNPSSYDNSYFINTHAYFNDSVILYYNAWIDKDAGKQLVDSILESKDYKNENKINFNNVTGLEVGERFVSTTDEIISYLQDAYESTEELNSVHEERVSFYVYRDGRSIEKWVSTKNSKKLQSWVEKEFTKRNKEVYQKIEKMSEENKNYLWIDFSSYDKEDFFSDYEIYDNYELNQRTREKWLSFIEKYHSDTLSFDQPVLILRLDGNYFYTNRVEEAKKLLDDAVEEWKNSEEPETYTEGKM